MKKVRRGADVAVVVGCQLLRAHSLSFFVDFIESENEGLIHTQRKISQHSKSFERASSHLPTNKAVELCWGP